MDRLGRVLEEKDDLLLDRRLMGLSGGKDTAIYRYHSNSGYNSFHIIFSS